MLATQPVVEALLLRALRASEVPFFAQLAASADAAVLRECPGLTISLGNETAVSTVGPDGDIWTPRYPVTFVTSVTIDGVAHTALTFEPYGPIAPSDDARWTPGRRATVVYGFGFAAAPADLGLIASELVVTALTGPRGGVRQEQLGDHMVGYGSGADGGRIRLDGDQRRRVRRYRRQITSIALDRAGP